MDIGLVLGGGGARGMAHVGAMRALAERGYRTVAIAGTSMGAITGALLAAGHDVNAIIALFNELGYADVLDFGERGALFGNKRLGKHLAKHLPKRFDELKIPLHVTAVDVQRGELIVLREGPLVPALLASSALPGVLSPIKIQDRYFVDGGLLNNLPVDLIRSMTHAPIVAIDVAMPPHRPLHFESQHSAWAKLKSPFKKGLAGLTFDLFMKSFDIPQALITEMRLAMHPPELHIQPKLALDIRMEDFGRRDEIIAAGYVATVKALEGFDQHAGV